MKFYLNPNPFKKYDGSEEDNVKCDWYGLERSGNFNEEGEEFCIEIKQYENVAQGTDRKYRTITIQKVTKPKYEKDNFQKRKYEKNRGDSEVPF